jgi:hypothetical protein
MHFSANSRAASRGSAGAEAASPARAGSIGLTATEAQRVVATLSGVGTVCALVALAVLGVRSALELHLRWDTFAYHIPFAALRGGLSIPYELSDRMVEAYQGYPPLPAFLQGALWRLTGSMNATGVVNYLAFATFLVHAHRALRAPFWLVALVALTAPMVVIQACASYIDLLGNAFVAIGACSCLSLYLFPEKATRAALVGGLLALAAAAWCKYLLVPPAALLMIAFAVLIARRSQIAGFTRRTAGCLYAAVVTLAAAPYIENWILYGNPFWPLRLPLVGDYFPYMNDALQGAQAEQLALQRRLQPGVAESPSQLTLFVKSLFEIDQPTTYPNRYRWIIDQGSTVAGFRTGGFWGVAALVYLLAVVGLLVTSAGRRGWVGAVAAVGMLGFVAALPQSHELRYYLFIPLTGAGVIGMLFPHFERVAPRAAMVLLALVLGLFVHMVLENRSHYRIGRVDYMAAAHAWGAAAWWPKLVRGKTYCAVAMEPIGIFLTGPTLSEYTIIERSRAEYCPPGSSIITRND